MGKNKIRYGLSNVHIYPITKDAPGEATTYGPVIKMTGAVTLSLSAESSSEPFYADNIVYYLASSNNGYTGSLELALIPDEYYTKILGKTKDEETGVLLESTDDKVSEFAMGYQFEGDENGIKHILFRCKATRPNIEGETKNESKTPKTESFNFTSMARISDGKIRAKAEPEATAYATFFDAPVTIQG